MNRWRSTSTADLIAVGALEIGDGYRAKNAEFRPEGLPFARVKNVKEGFDFASVDLFPVAELHRVGRKVSEPGDSVISMKGSVGRVAFVDRSTPRFVYSPQLSYWRSLDPDLVDPLYLRYWMEGPEFVRQCAQVKGATDMADYVNLRDQRRMRISLPPIKTQRSIGAAVRIFDDLIENNRRRIEILEEMARLLYREWFVHFRFPGHEDVDLVDSDLGPIPEGWVVRPFSELADFVNGFAFKPSHLGETGLPIIKIKELKGGVADGTPRYHGDDIKAKYFIGDGDVLFSWSADLDAYIWASGPGLLNQHLFVVRPHELPDLFVFHSLRGRMDQFRARSQGTTMKHIKRSALTEVSTVVPDKRTLDAFRSKFGPPSKLVINLTQQNRVLREARDLLLPRLVSGELDVSELDLDGLLA